MPADATAAGQLAGRYRSEELGVIQVSRRDQSTWFDFGAWKSEVATRKNDDATLSYVTISPGVDGFELVVADAREGRGLMLRDAQHEYRFEESK